MERAIQLEKHILIECYTQSQGTKLVIPFNQVDYIPMNMVFCIITMKQCMSSADSYHRQLNMDMLHGNMNVMSYSSGNCSCLVVSFSNLPYKLRHFYIDSGISDNIKRVVNPPYNISIKLECHRFLMHIYVINYKAPHYYIYLWGAQLSVLHTRPPSGAYENWKLYYCCDTKEMAHTVSNCARNYEALMYYDYVRMSDKLYIYFQADTYNIDNLPYNMKNVYIIHDDYDWIDKNRNLRNIPQLCSMTRILSPAYNKYHLYWYYASEYICIKWYKPYLCTVCKYIVLVTSVLCGGIPLYNICRKLLDYL
jgi:hypothetical protein